MSSLPDVVSAPVKQNTTKAKNRRQQTRARLNKQKRDKGQKLLQELLHLADFFPEFAKHLKPSLEAVRRETDRTYHSDRERVVLSIEQGAWIVQDIMDDTGLSRWDVEKILASLRKLGLVEKTARRVKTSQNEYIENLYTLRH